MILQSDIPPSQELFSQSASSTRASVVPVSAIAVFPGGSLDSLAVEGSSWGRELP